MKTGDKIRELRFGVFDTLQIVLIVLKAFGLTEISWVAVFAPTWIWLVFVIGLMITLGIVSMWD